MPAKLRKILRAAKRQGVEAVRPSRGSHWKLKKAGYRTYPIPAHGRNHEISDVYIQGLIRHFDLDEERFLADL